MTKMRALEAALNTVWAMEDSALETLMTIAAREHEVTLEALEAYRAKQHDKAENMDVRDGVAILSVNGALIKRATFFSAMSGATSYDILRRDLQAALDDPKIKAIMFNVDSPGGEASGPAELASAINAARGQKPIRAYVNGQAASAAYWIAAAVGPGNIVIDPTAILGSIGVQMGLRSREDPKGTTTFRFISSQSPMKNADPASEAGAAHIQGVVDAMASVFVGAVAEYRGVDTETVLSKFGRGGIFVGQDAIDAGLADRIGTFESVFAELVSAPRRSQVKPKGAKMADENYTQAALDAAVASAVTTALAAQNARTASITQIGANLGASTAEISAAIAAGTDPIIFATEQSGKSAERQAAAIAAAEAKIKAEAAAAGAPGAAALSALKSDEELAADVAASSGKDTEGAADALVSEILASAKLASGE